MFDKPYVIHHRRPYRCLLMVLLSIVITSAVAWFGLHYWYQDQLEQLQVLTNEHQTLLAEHQKLTSENQNLMSQVDNTTQMQALQKATDDRLQADIQSLQEKVMSLNKELLFYQNITQGNASSELQVRELHLRASQETPDSYIYRIVITQGQRVNDPIKGEVDIVINGAVSENTTTRVAKTQEMSIRHVQIIEGILTLETDEQPTSLKIRIRQNKKVITERDFDWKATLTTEP